MPHRVIATLNLYDGRSEKDTEKEARISDGYRFSRGGKEGKWGLRFIRESLLRGERKALLRA